MELISIVFVVLIVGVQVYFSTRYFAKAASKLQKGFVVVTSLFQIVFSIWLMLFVTLGYFGSIHF